MMNGSYRYGFNGQELDNELKGDGNSYTAEFWQYDPRLGRRWNPDPVIKPHLSLYSTFSNNPIIYVDPNGDTDYYNLKGEKIGSDGIDNGLNLFILRKVTQGKIKRNMNKHGAYTLTSFETKYSAVVPDNNALTKMEDVYTKTENNASEYGFIGSHKGNSRVYAGTSGSKNALPSFIPATGITELAKKGILPALIYTVHSHPLSVRFNVLTNSFTTSGDGASIADMDLGKQTTYVDYVLQVRSLIGFENLSKSDEQSAKNQPGTWIPRTDPSTRTIIFYNGFKTIRDMNFSTFKTICEKVNNNSNQTDFNSEFENPYKWKIMSDDGSY